MTTQPPAVSGPALKPRTHPTSPATALIEESCQVKGCSQLAEVTCEFCGRRCCVAHSQRISLQRREERGEVPGGRMTLTRVPSHPYTFTLCPRCGKRSATDRRQA
jgi:hypothetical protein